MSKARGLADLGNAFNDGALSNRNLIINGAMQVAQRGTSQSVYGYGSVDRYFFTLSGGTGTMSQEVLPLGQTDIPSQFRNFLRISATVGDNYMGLVHRIENVASVEGLVTISFYAKGSNPAAGSFSLSTYQEFGTGGSTGVSASEDAFTVTSSWQRFEFTVTLPSLSGKTLGSNNCLELAILQGGSDTGTAAWTLDITGVQLEVGDTATPFEHRSYGQELALCQRYYRQSDNHAMFFGCSVGSNSYIYSPILTNVNKHMRAIPTVSSTDLSGGNWASQTLHGVGYANDMVYGYVKTAVQLNDCYGYAVVKMDSEL